MIRFLSFLCAVLFAQNVMAATHLDLSLNVDFEQRVLKVSGTASKPVTLPSGEVTQEFDYIWKMPENQSAETWRSGSFVSDREFYFPWRWHPRTEGLLTFHLKTKSPIRLISTGRIEKEVMHADGFEVDFVMEKPTEAIPLFGGPYAIHQMRHKGILLRTYFYEGMEDLSKGYLLKTAQYLDRFADQIGPYPFDNFHIIASPLPVGYGFAGLTYMGRRVLALPFIKDTSLGHEILHNYWGNGVFPDYQTGNWSEGLTTYMADYMSAELSSVQKAREMRLSWLRDYSALPEEADRPIREFVSKHSQSSQVIGYHKAAFVFHMLRNRLGEENFFDGLRYFWKEHAFATASWDDLKDSFEHVSGQNLDRFFQQWIMGKGALDLGDIYAHIGNEGQRLEISVTQKGRAFDVYLPLTIGDAKVKMHLQKEKTVKSIDLLEKANNIQLDTDFDIFRRLKKDEAPVILRDVMLAQNVGLSVLSVTLEKDALALALRMSDGEVKEFDIQEPFVLVGLHVDIEKALKELSLQQTMSEKIEGAIAYVWSGKTKQDVPYIVVSVSNEQALKDLMRPLPHYGKRSALVFQGSRAILKRNGENKPFTVKIQ